jgi:6-phosphogluconolactonase
VTRPALRFFEAPDQVSTALARWCADLLWASVTARGAASLAVPGGATPARFLTLLGALPLPWPQITLLLTDERRVAVDHPRSNERMLRASFDPLASGLCRYVSLVDAGGGDATIFAAAQSALTCLLPLDICICGMGEDGHIASLFPHDPGWKHLLPVEGQSGGDPLLLLAEPPGLEPRITLSPAMLAGARERAVLISGQGKRDALPAALAAASPAEAPVQLLGQGAGSWSVFAD